MSVTIINAQPTSDPRWAEEDELKLRGGGSDTGSLLLKHQLEEKIQKHAMFFAFLHDTNLWQAIEDEYRVTLFAHSEKLHATSALRDHQNRVSSEVFVPLEKGNLHFYSLFKAPFLFLLIYLYLKRTEASRKRTM